MLASKHWPVHPSATPLDNYITAVEVKIRKGVADGWTGQCIDANI